MAASQPIPIVTSRQLVRSIGNSTRVVTLTNPHVWQPLGPYCVDPNCLECLVQPPGQPSYQQYITSCNQPTLCPMAAPTPEWTIADYGPTFSSIPVPVSADVGFGTPPLSSSFPERVETLLSLQQPATPAPFMSVPMAYKYDQFSSSIPLDYFKPCQNMAANMPPTTVICPPVLYEFDKFSSGFSSEYLNPCQNMADNMQPTTPVPMPVSYGFFPTQVINESAPVRQPFEDAGSLTESVQKSRATTLSSSDSIEIEMAKLKLESAEPQTSWSRTKPQTADATRPQHRTRVFHRTPPTKPIPSPFGCKFCINNGETKKWCDSHKLKTKTGITSCPILRKYVCPMCSATGDNAHSLRYCPENPASVVNQKDGSGNPSGDYDRTKQKRNSRGVIGHYRYD